MKKLKLLFVDDETNLLTVCKKFFDLKDYSVFTADSGLKGLKVANHEKPDLIILDLKMPGIDGLETLKKIRKKDKKTKVIILTGYGTAEHIREGAKLGISDFIAKPFDMNELLHMITEILESGSP